MLFALNYSPQAAALLAAGRIEIDFFKTPPWPEMIAKAEQHRPVAVHFTLRAGRGDLETHADWEGIEHILHTTATRFVNLHLAADARDGLPFDTDAPAPEEQQRILANLHADVAAAVARFGAENVILENSPYRVGEGRTNRVCALPAVIVEIVREHNCGLLLDISHARISAAALGMQAKAYLRALPLKALRELHFTGLHEGENGYLMDHLGVLESDWPWLDWVLDGVRARGWGKPHLLAFEYGGEGHPFFDAHSDSQVIARDVPPMLARCRGMREDRPQSAGRS